MANHCKSPANKRKVKGAINKLDCVKLRITGATYSQIGEKLGIASVTAFKHVQQALKDIRDETEEKAEELKQIEVLRLDNHLLQLAARCQKGDPYAISVALKVAEHRAKLLGLNVISQNEIGDGVQLEIVFRKSGSVNGVADNE